MEQFLILIFPFLKFSKVPAPPPLFKILLMQLLARTDPLEAKDRNARGQGPITQAQVFSKKKSSKFFSGGKGLKTFFSGNLQLKNTKKGLLKFSAKFLTFFNKISTIQKIVLSSSREQGNFRGLGASRPRPRTSKCVFEDSTSDRKFRGSSFKHQLNIQSRGF